MLIFLLILLLISNAVTMRRDKSILFYRIAIKSLLLIAFITYNNIYTLLLSKGIGLYGGLLNITTFTLTFNIFILLVSAVILTFTELYIIGYSYKINSLFIDVVYYSYTGIPQFNTIQLIFIKLYLLHNKYKN